MNDVPLDSLDHLCGRALSGDEVAEARLYEELRVRLRRVAQRRVRSDDLEDVLQEGLRVIHLKLRSRAQTGGVLPWSMAILRNVVGSYYRKRALQARQSRRAIDPHTGSARAPAPDEARERAEEMDRLSRALERLSRSHPRCGEFYREILRSLGSAAEETRIAGAASVLARFPEMTSGAFYVALHRCRSRLWKIIEEMERGAER